MKPFYFDFCFWYLVNFWKVKPVFVETQRITVYTKKTVWIGPFGFSFVSKQNANL